jgi:hypothetical protein
MRSSISAHSRNGRIVDSNIEILLEPVHSDTYRLTYTCFLFPLLRSSRLTRNLRAPLSNSVKEICLKNRWSLEFVRVNSKYLQWSLTVPVAVPTTQIIQFVRAKSSKCILDGLSQKTKADAADYWAPGYLLLYGLHPRPVKVVEQYLRMIRSQQH